MEMMGLFDSSLLEQKKSQVRVLMLRQKQCFNGHGEIEHDRLYSRTMSLYYDLEGFGDYLREVGLETPQEVGMGRAKLRELDAEFVAVRDAVDRIPGISKVSRGV